MTSGMSCVNRSSFRRRLLSRSITNEESRMASAKATIDLNVPPDEVWQLIGGFGSLPDWLPYVPQSKVTDGGRVRHLDNPDGQTIVERLEKYDFSARTYSYSILQAPFPVTGYLSTITVTPTNGGKGSHVEW